MVRTAAPTSEISACRSTSLESAAFLAAYRDQGREERPGHDRRDLESFEEAGELPARSPEGRPVRRLSLHVPPAGARRVPPGPRADPGVGNVRPLHSSPGDYAEGLTFCRRPSS